VVILFSQRRFFAGNDEELEKPVTVSEEIIITETFLSSNGSSETTVTVTKTEETNTSLGETGGTKDSTNG
jgi:hypothetical protein